MNKCLHFVLVFNLIKQTFQRTEDYFSENFDVNKNCEKEDVIRKLLDENQDERCSVTTQGYHFIQTEVRHEINSFMYSCKGSDELQWESCKKELMKKVANKCFPRELKKAKKPFKLYKLSKSYLCRSVSYFIVRIVA